MSDHQDPPNVARIRPYLATGGRTRADTALLPIETVLATSGDPARPLRFEAQAIVDRCRREPTSTVDLASDLDLPLGIVSVLVADLVAESIIQPAIVEPVQGGDVAFIEQLIAEVEAL